MPRRKRASQSEAGDEFTASCRPPQRAITGRCGPQRRVRSHAPARDAYLQVLGAERSGPSSGAESEASRRWNPSNRTRNSLPVPPIRSGPRSGREGVLQPLQQNSGRAGGIYTVPRRGPKTASPLARAAHASSKASYSVPIASTERATSPLFSASNASLISPNAQRFVTRPSMSSLPCLYSSRMRGMSVWKRAEP